MKYVILDKRALEMAGFTKQSKTNLKTKEKLKIVALIAELKGKGFKTKPKLTNLKHYQNIQHATSTRNHRERQAPSQPQNSLV